MSLLGRVHQTLTAAGCEHALIGAGALAARGVVRSTFDLDLLTVSAVALEPATWSTLGAEGPIIEVRVGDGEDPLAGVIRIEAAGERAVDVVVGKAPWQARIIARAEALDVLGLRLRVAGAADLILLKLYAGGTRDRWDIEELLASAEDQDLLFAVDQRVVELPHDASDLWSDLRDAHKARGC